MEKIRAIAVMTVCCAAFLAAVPLQGQEPATVNFADRSNVLVGYVINPPRQMLGFGVVGTVGRWNGLGLLVDGRITTDSPARETVLSGRTPGQAHLEGDIFNVDQNAWSTLNLAVVKALSAEFAAYFGGGLTWETAYLRYFDPSRERGELGFYWVEDEEDSGTHPNVVGGVFFRMGNRLAVQMGGQSVPMGVVVGAHLRLR